MPRGTKGQEYRTDARFEVRILPSGTTCVTKITDQDIRTLFWMKGFWITMKTIWKLIWQGYRVDVLD